MKILFDIVHPAQVHFFKNVICLLRQRGDEVLVTAREKDVTLNLLNALGIEYTCISKKGPNLPALALELIVRNFRLWKIARKFRPDVMIARVGVAAGPVGKVLGIPTVVYDDMEHARLQAAVGMTFATYICTGLGYYRDFGKRQIRFRGLPVLAYLGPKYFEPNKELLRKEGFDPDKPYIFIRIVSWGASHDVGRAGSTENELVRLVERLLRFGRIIISAEGPLPQSLSQYENPVGVENVHHLLAFASLCLVEGGTMAAEAAVLGTPAICLEARDFKLGYLNALENEYGLVYQPESFEKVLEVAEGLLVEKDLKQLWGEKRKKMLAVSDDVTQFQLDMIDRAVKEHPVKRR